MKTRLTLLTLLAGVTLVGAGCDDAGTATTTVSAGSFEYPFNTIVLTSAGANATSGIQNSIHGVVTVDAAGTVGGTGYITYTYLSPCSWEPPYPDQTAPSTDQEYCALTGVDDAQIAISGTVTSYVDQSDDSALAQAVYQSLDTFGVPRVDQAPSQLELTFTPTGVPQEKMNFWGFQDGHVEAHPTGAGAYGMQAAHLFEPFTIAPIATDERILATTEQLDSSLFQHLFEGSSAATDTYTLAKMSFVNGARRLSTSTDPGVWGGYSANYPSGDDVRELSQAELDAIAAYDASDASPSDSHVNWYDDFADVFVNAPTSEADQLREVIVEVNNFYNY